MLSSTVLTIVNSPHSTTGGLDLLTTPFMRNALIAGTLIGLVSGAIGYFVLLRDLPFATHAVAHIGFPGATFAVLIGVSSTWGLLAGCVAGGLAISVLSQSSPHSREVVTGTVLAFASALGILFNSLGSKQSGLLTNTLFGNILAVSRSQVLTFLLITVAVLAMLAVTGRQLMFASIDPVVAQARGVPIHLLGAMFIVAMSFVIAISVTVVGVLLIFALLVTPAATAVKLTARPFRVVVIATSIALVSIWSGLVVATYQPWPPSFVITTIACGLWVILPMAFRPRLRTRRTTIGLA
jgi:zinc/manganese transport system permease protein